MPLDDSAEWLEADGLGGFASGTATGIRTRRYHALLLPALTPPTGRMVLVNGVDAWIDTRGGTFALSSHRYHPGVVHPDGHQRIVAFQHEPWPRWEFETLDGIRIAFEIVVSCGTAGTVLRWTVLRSDGRATLRVRPFLSGRDYHGTHHENGAFRFEPELTVSDTDAPDGHTTSLRFTPYDGVPGIEIHANGSYSHSPQWYRNFLYAAERERGLDDTEDLAAPGELAWELAGAGATAVCLMRQTGSPAEAATPVSTVAAGLIAQERTRRAMFETPLDRAADAYIVRRRAGRTIVAGYPWFTDWGRDAFIALRGLCLATGRLREARDILLEWSGAISEGMLPNRFPDSGEALEFNAVDASLWYVVAVHELLQEAQKHAGLLSPGDEHTLRRAVAAIVSGYAAGTRYGIRLDEDGLLQAGAPGLQLTWMDARVGDRVITPRVGKPVEVQALWLNALAVAAADDPRWNAILSRGRDSFIDRFWIESTGQLADVVDVDHVRGTRDDSCRPNQILAVGGLPLPLVEGDRARRIVATVEQRLLTPLGLRSLAPGEPGYAARYEGGPSSRDAIYHQGIVWPWLIGPFVDAWLRSRGDTPEARDEARSRFLQPLLAHLDAAGLGHVSEIADAEPPFAPRGCPFQAWSVGELLRLDRKVLSLTPSPILGIS